MNPDTIPVPVNEWGTFDRACVAGPPGEYWVAWLRGGLDKELFYRARSWSEAIRLSKRINARINEAQGGWKITWASG